VSQHAAFVAEKAARDAGRRGAACRCQERGVHPSCVALVFVLGACLHRAAIESLNLTWKSALFSPSRCSSWDRGGRDGAWTHVCSRDASLARTHTHKKNQPNKKKAKSIRLLICMSFTYAQMQIENRSLKRYPTQLGQKRSQMLHTLLSSSTL